MKQHIREHYSEWLPLFPKWEKHYDDLVAYAKNTERREKLKAFLDNPTMIPLNQVSDRTLQHWSHVTSSFNEEGEFESFFRIFERYNDFNQNANVIHFSFDHDLQPKEVGLQNAGMIMQMSCTFKKNQDPDGLRYKMSFPSPRADGNDFLDLLLEIFLDKAEEWIASNKYVIFSVVKESFLEPVILKIKNRLLCHSCAVVIVEGGKKSVYADAMPTSLIPNEWQHLRIPTIMSGVSSLSPKQTAQEITESDWDLLPMVNHANVTTIGQESMNENSDSFPMSYRRYLRYISHRELYFGYNELLQAEVSDNQ